MLTFPCVSVQRENNLTVQSVLLPELFAKYGGLLGFHLGVQQPRRGQQKAQCVSMCYNVSICTFKSIETHYSLCLCGIRIDGPSGGLAVPGLDVPDFALLFSVSAPPNVNLRWTLKFTCSILRHIELRSKQQNRPGHCSHRKGHWSGSFLGEHGLGSSSSIQSYLQCVQCVSMCCNVFTAHENTLKHINYLVRPCKLSSRRRCSARGRTLRECLVSYLAASRAGLRLCGSSDP